VPNKGWLANFVPNLAAMATALRDRKKRVRSIIYDKMPIPIVEKIVKIDPVDAEISWLQTKHRYLARQASLPGRPNNSSSIASDIGPLIASSTCVRKPSFLMHTVKLALNLNYRTV